MKVYYIAEECGNQMSGHEERRIGALHLNRAKMINDFIKEQERPSEYRLPCGIRVETYTVTVRDDTIKVQADQEDCRYCTYYIREEEVEE